MPHVMPKWYRDNPGLVDEKTKQNRDEHADRERREFIREATIRIFCLHEEQGGTYGPSFRYTPGEAVKHAQNLWAAIAEADV